jgi:hypothetical protein
MATKAKLHEILAVEKARTGQVKTLLEDTSRKFNKAADYFSGHLKSLKLIKDDPANAATEAAAREQRQLPTTVVETLDYLFKHWAIAEDVLLQKSLTNQVAKADIVLADGKTLASNVPVDELLGLESRLEELRKIFHAMPTNRADTKYAPADDGRKGSWTAVDADITTKTERIKEPFIKAPATDKHPAQVDVIEKDVVVGTFTNIKLSGAATTLQKANVIELIDDLVAATKQARMRANTVEVLDGRVGAAITGYLMQAFK